MATVYRAPIEAPVIDWRGGREVWSKQVEEYVARVAQMARGRGATHPLVGEVVRFSVADGYAEYVVWNVKPLQLVHLDHGDAYSIQPAHMRGLRLADIKAMVENERRWKALMDERRAAQA